jgi:hypothetical protein
LFFQSTNNDDGDYKLYSTPNPPKGRHEHKEKGYKIERQSALFAPRCCCCCVGKEEEKKGQEEEEEKNVS